MPNYFKQLIYNKNNVLFCYDLLLFADTSTNLKMGVFPAEFGSTQLLELQSMRNHAEWAMQSHILCILEHF